jgi:two-component system KDP operon response regulator KdpE
LTQAKPRVLVVDDDAAICQIYKEVLQGEGYDVVTAGTVAEAMAQMDAANGGLDVLVVDLGLPDGDGGDFVRDATKRYGDRPTLFVSGWTDEFWQLNEAPGRWVVMRKPVPIKRLLAAVRWLAHGGERPPELDEQ